MHLDDLSDQTFLADTYNVGHIRITHTGRDDQRSCYFFDRTCTTHVDESPYLSYKFTTAQLLHRHGLAVTKQNVRSYSYLYGFFHSRYSGSGISCNSRNLDNSRNDLLLIF